jgi:integrase
MLDGNDCESRTEDAGYKSYLNGNTARRKFNSYGHVWDSVLSGFALRHFASGEKLWIVQYRQRGETRRETIGKVADIAAQAARKKARAILAEVSLDGLPVPASDALRGGDILFADYARIFWEHNALRWKASTRTSERSRLRCLLIPEFGERSLGSFAKSDILAWRDSMARRPGMFNRSLPLLSVMLGYAETLGYRRPGSNPCKGTPRYKTVLKERFLSPREFQRLGAALRNRIDAEASIVALIWLLIYTGARKHEIKGLRWEWIGQDYIDLPDSKTGPKRLYLNRQANSVLDGLGRLPEGSVFLKLSSVHLSDCWAAVRKEAQLEGLRLHDLRHSFASVAIMRGVSLSFIGALLGHVLPETTARYAHLADDSISEAADRVCGSLALAMGLSA